MIPVLVHLLWPRLHEAAVVLVVLMHGFISLEGYTSCYSADNIEFKWCRLRNTRVSKNRVSMTPLHSSIIHACMTLHVKDILSNYSIYINFMTILCTVGTIPFIHILSRVVVILFIAPFMLALDPLWVKH